MSEVKKEKVQRKGRKGLVGKKYQKQRDTQEKNENQKGNNSQEKKFFE